MQTNQLPPMIFSEGSFHHSFGLSTLHSQRLEAPPTTDLHLFSSPLIKAHLAKFSHALYALQKTFSLHLSCVPTWYLARPRFLSLTLSLFLSLSLSHHCHNFTFSPEVFSTLQPPNRWRLRWLAARWPTLPANRLLCLLSCLFSPSDPPPFSLYLPLDPVDFHS